MIQLVLLTGFLGAGKTTFLNHTLKEYADSRVGLIVNEFSSTGVDGALVDRTIEGMEMIELNNGSIFCACIKDKFVDSLIELSKRDLEYAFIEASGLADPSSISSILEQIQHLTKNPFQYCGSVCLTDALYFIKYFALLPALKRQIEYSHSVLINKIDLVDETQISSVVNTIKEANPNASIYKTTYSNVSLKDILNTQQKDIAPAPQESTNTTDSRPKTVTLQTKEAISDEKLQQFIQEISPYTYRIKGFCKTLDGTKNVSIVGTIPQIESYPITIEETQLVIISSIGIGIISKILAATKHIFAEPVELL